MAHLVGALTACLCLAAPAAPLRIVHVTVISPERATPLRDATVTIRNGRIAQLGTGGPAAGRATKPTARCA